jgi:hypothetical protein
MVHRAGWARWACIHDPSRILLSQTCWRKAEVEEIQLQANYGDKWNGTVVCFARRPQLHPGIQTWRSLLYIQCCCYSSTVKFVRFKRSFATDRGREGKPLPCLGMYGTENWGSCNISMHVSLASQLESFFRYSIVAKLRLIVDTPSRARMCTWCEGKPRSIGRCDMYHLNPPGWAPHRNELDEQRRVYSIERAAWGSVVGIITC